MYKKRTKMLKEWPIPRKGSKYVSVASHASNKSIPLLVVLRDILEVVKTKKEAKYVLFNSEVKVNNKVRKSEKFPLQVFDTISIEKMKMNYKLVIEGNKYKLVEVKGKDADTKIVKIIGKKLLSNGRVQMNLEDGQNFIVKDKFSVGDSAVVNTKQDKIEKVLVLEKGCNVEVVSGKHSGEKGSLKEIIEIEKGKRYLIKLKDAEVKLPFKTVLVIE